MGTGDGGDLAVGAAIAAAADTWPSFRLDSSSFHTFVTERATEGGGESIPHDRLCLEDLYLAAGCLQRVPAAVDAFVSAYAHEFALVARRTPRANVDPNDFSQMLQKRMLVGSADHPPQLHQFRGTGCLRSWLRVVSVRALRDLPQAQRALRTNDAETSAERSWPTKVAANNPEFATVWTETTGRFKECFVAAVEQLSARDRNLLRHRFVRDMTVSAIAASYGVHRVTVSRWMRDLHAKVRTSMQASLGDVSLSDIRSQLDLSLPRLLEGPAESPVEEARNDAREAPLPPR